MLSKLVETVNLSPAVGSSFRNWMKVLYKNRHISIKAIPRILLVCLLSLLGVPFRIYEYLRVHKMITNYTLKEDPIFIIGHWRSGTTHLHNLLCQDPQFGFVTMYQSAFPKSFLCTSFFKIFLKLFMPDTRPMDSMELHVDKPQEEELGLGNLCPYSFYNGFYFPEDMMKHFYHYIRFKNVNGKVKCEWKKNYLYLLKAATINMKGKKLILKNPVNTARIEILREMFPNAKFIHIYRNPYVVYLSTKRFYEKAIKYFMLQKISDKELDENILKIYNQMMKSFFNEIKSIPKENFVEIKFEDLERNPIEQIKKIYQNLHIGGFNRAKDLIQKYLKTISDYKKNRYKLDLLTIKKIKDSWNFTIKKWNYSVPLIS
ncbi:MAG: sulfotransferase [Candidatus Lokiarchaeota archaeon]